MPITSASLCDSPGDDAAWVWRAQVGAVAGSLKEAKKQRGYEACRLLAAGITFRTHIAFLLSLVCTPAHAPPQNMHNDRAALHPVRGASVVCDSTGLNSCTAACTALVPPPPPPAPAACPPLPANPGFLAGPGSAQSSAASPAPDCARAPQQSFWRPTFPLTQPTNGQQRCKCGRLGRRRTMRFQPKFSAEPAALQSKPIVVVQKTAFLNV